ncbi:hypothetical protein [Mucilaginibacter gotjawali]|uniref:Uncharacterized protein n=2 Tax=Mucilaginibacter gotjawali TaxID=1550579 RepID=A0A120MZ44_9SPHI|nr:hypothetical protein [Mucilaginibacter gotjawali]MBB3057555.1 hypothetical protein [Mucilaginibacter gotjawali]BAU55213.1 hypothetical protein MgSA37_03394 [Mucilaginibacter gotjawali]
MERFIGTLSIFILMSVLSSCLTLGDDESNKLIKESANKIHTKKAILFLREGGATVGDSYQVSLVDCKSAFDTTVVGNTFTVDDDHGKARLYPASINFKWLTDNNIEISYDKRLRTFIMEQSVNGVKVVYKTN